MNLGESDLGTTVDTLIDGMGDAEREEYWKTQSSLSTVSATTVGYADACATLGYDPLHPTPFPALWQDRQDEIDRRGSAQAGASNAAENGPVTPTAPLPEVLELNGWQVTGVAWAIQQESLPIRGSIIADDCGTGKTVIMLTTILEGARRAVRDAAAGARGPWKPTLIIAPPHVVDVWVEEVTRFFASELDIWRFYESKDKVANHAMRDRTLPHTAVRLLEWLDLNCPNDNPASCAKIIVTAYDTLMTRALHEEPRKGPGKPRRF